MVLTVLKWCGGRCDLVDAGHQQQQYGILERGQESDTRGEMRVGSRDRVNNANQQPLIEGAQM